MLSYWEKQSFTNYDIAVIGSGITGLSTAISLKEKDNSLSIIVLEKGLLPTGASTKNAGFACVGSLTEILDDLKTHTEQEIIDLILLRKQGLEILRKRLGDSIIDYQENGSYELLFEKPKNLSQQILSVNKLLFPVFGRDIFSISIKKFGFSDKVKTFIESTAEGQLDTGKMMKALVQKAIKHGIEIKTGYEVADIIDTENGVTITNSKLSLKANKVCVCTNAFTPKLFPNLDIKPGRGQVLITEPILDLKFKGIFHFDEGYYYFRTIHNRVLFGGGRNVDFDVETSNKFELNDTIQKDLEEKLKKVILPNTVFKIAERWTGIMAFGETKKSIIEQTSKNIYAAVRFGGMGIAIGSKAGELLSNLILKK